MGQNRAWAKEEEDRLRELWGTKPIDIIAKELNRTVNAIRVRKQKIGLGAFLDNGDYITVNQLYQTLSQRRCFSNYQMKSWVNDRGMPIHYKRVGTTKWRVVYLDEFWQWAEKNRSFVDFSRLEPNILGKEPEWVQEQRKKDINACRLQRKDPWTRQEDEKLKWLLEKQQYGYAELSGILQRSEGAIQKRCSDLGIKARPVRVDPHAPEAVWTEEMLRILADGIRTGSGYSLIGKEIGKSEKAVRGKVFNTYFTENEDKVRALLGTGKWGENRPQPTVRQAKSMSEFRQGIKKDISAIAGILRYRANEIGYEPYWQRLQCVWWDDNHGCGMNCASCDECTEFKRIPPQFCKRCGCTFYERKERTFCAACRTARKKQGYKKYCRERGRV